LPADLGLDELPSDLIAEGARDRLQLGELGLTREAIGIDRAPQFPGDLTQPNAKLIPDGGGVLAHFCSPHQVDHRMVVNLGFRTRA
jgi:hypothetical protein